MQSADPLTAPSPHLPVRADWLARRQEEILEPDLQIVDPHHHLVDRENTGRYLLPELLADTGSGHNITATVYLEWLSMYRASGPAELRPIGEIEFANGVAAMSASGTYGKTQVCAGIVGYADLTIGAAVEKVLEAMIVAGGGRFRGIRFITASHPDQAAWGSMVTRPEGLLRDKRVREGFARLAPLGLSFDAWMYHTQLRRPRWSRAHLSGYPNRARPCRRPDRPGPLRWQARRGVRRMERPDPRAGSLPQCACQAGRAGHADVRVRPPHARIAAELGGTRRRLAALYRDLHRRLRPRARDVREQFPGRQGQLQLRRAVERLQAHRRRLLRRRKGGAVRRHSK